MLLSLTRISRSGMCSGNAFQMLLFSFAFSTHLRSFRREIRAGRPVGRRAQEAHVELWWDSVRYWHCVKKNAIQKRWEECPWDTGGGSGREYVTVIGCGAADGTKLPPYVIYKSKNLWSSWTMGGPCRYTLHSIRIRMDDFDKRSKQFHISLSRCYLCE